MNGKTLVWSAAVIVFVALVFLLGRAGRSDDGSDDAAPSATTTASDGKSNGSTDGSGNGGGAGATPPPSTNTITLALDAEGSVGNVAIRPTTVIEDSRCPATVQCVWAGTFRVNVVLAANSSVATRTMELGKPEAIPGGYSVTLTGVTPAAVAGGTPKLETYRLTFLVEER